VLDELLTFWSPLAIVTALGSGVAMAIVITHLRPTADVRLTAFLGYVLGVLWYAPQVIQRLLDPTAPEGSGWRTVGTMLLYLVGFATPLAATLTIHARRRP
jgi:hypothetical protein